MTAAEFLRALWGARPPGWIACWRLANKTSSYYQDPEAAGLIAPSEADLYTGVALAPADLGPKRRTPNAKAVAIAGLWADIDVDGGPDEKKGAAPSREEALDLAGSITEPTILVDSGYGLQGWWLFEESWRFGTYGEQRLAARAAAQWQKLHRDSVRWGIDYTHDLARILRLPGTLNGKGGERVPVRVIDTGPRHERDELLELAGRAGDVDPGYAIGERRNVAVSCRPDTAKPPRLAELVHRSPAFRRVWRHERDDLPSMSEHDMALVSIAALAGWEDQELADLIVCHRKTHDAADPKASRIDYVRRTIARVRESAGQEPERDRRPKTSSGHRKGTLTAAQWADVIGERLEASDDAVIPVPFRGINAALDGGLRPGQVCLVAGYTSHGKSVIVDQLADHAAESGRRVHLYLTEMTAYARGLRLLARSTRVPFARLKRRELDADQWRRVVEALNRVPYGCSIVSDWTVEDVVADIRENRWDVAVVDLIHGFHYADERDLSRSSSAIVRAAKGSAGDGHPGTAIVCAAHLNDGQMRDSRSNRRPRPGLHSLKGSSSLKQDADVVMFIWRQDDEDGLPEPEGALWVAKNRDGGMGAVDVVLDSSTMEFNEAPSLRVAV